MAARSWAAHVLRNKVGRCSSSPMAAAGPSLQAAGCPARPQAQPQPHYTTQLQPHSRGLGLPHVVGLQGDVFGGDGFLGDVLHLPHGGHDRVGGGGALLTRLGHGGAGHRHHQGHLQACRPGRRGAGSGWMLESGVNTGRQRGLQAGAAKWRHAAHLNNVRLHCDGSSACHRQAAGLQQAGQGGGQRAGGRGATVGQVLVRWPAAAGACARGWLLAHGQALGPCAPDTHTPTPLGPLRRACTVKSRNAVATRFGFAAWQEVAGDAPWGPHKSHFRSERFPWRRPRPAGRQPAGRGP